MKISRIAQEFLAGCFLSFAIAGQSGAYNFEDTTWQRGSRIVMQLALGAEPISLQDGFKSWNDSAADAVAIWNGYLDFVTFSSVSNPGASKAPHDGRNTVFFSNTIFGDSFGEGILAVTILQSGHRYPPSTTQADVIVNTAFRLDSYSGPLQQHAGDIHRILLHEFGHVLGLAHVPNHPPGKAIMEPVISNLDHLSEDDVEGVRLLYGAQMSNNFSPFSMREGDPLYIRMDYLQANNNPTSYTIVGLPPGTTYNPSIREITGNPTVGGVFAPFITAHGPLADAYLVLPITVLGFERVPGLLKILRVAGDSMVADPIRSRVYAAGPEGISMIDTNTFTVTNLISSEMGFPQLSISADSSALLYTVPFSQTPVMNRISLNTLASLPALPIPADSSPVLEGLNNHDYVASWSGIAQFDRATGELQTTVALSSFPYVIPPQVALSPDGTRLFAAVKGIGSYLLTYDVTGAAPVLVKSITGAFSHPFVSPDGQYLYAFGRDESSHGYLLQAHLPAVDSMTSFASGAPDGPFAVGLSGTIYHAGLPPDPILPYGGTLGSFGLYDPVSLQPLARDDPNSLDPAAGPSYDVGSAVFDKTGKYYFVSVSGIYGLEVWVFSTELSSLPAPTPSPASPVLNISTRLRVEEGQDAMIGGFIVQGPSPKKVLVRGLGPSLPITGALADPVLDLYNSKGERIATNDNWITNRLNVLGTQLAPSSVRESAIPITLQPGAYTAVVHDHRDQPGLALVEIYDLQTTDSLLANISTRGKVGIGDDVMIGGFIIGGTQTTRVLVRALGPSLAQQGVKGSLLDPVLELHNGAGTLIATNDDWQSAQSAAIVATGIPPHDSREASILATLPPGNYTAIVRGKNNSTGVGLVEVYNLDASK